MFEQDRSLTLKLASNERQNCSSANHPTFCLLTPDNENNWRRRGENLCKQSNRFCDQGILPLNWTPSVTLEVLRGRYREGKILDTWNEPSVGCGQLPVWACRRQGSLPFSPHRNLPRSPVKLRLRWRMDRCCERLILTHITYGFSQVYL